MSEELSGPVTLYVKLPVGVTCDQCIVQVGQTVRMSVTVLELHDQILDCLLSPPGRGPTKDFQIISIISLIVIVGLSGRR